MEKKEGLTYDEAISALKDGKKVRVPEWTGYWFNDENGNIKVFTRTGDILDTPQHDNYNMRTDWQIAPDGLGFDFAILAIKAGKLVSREGWNGKGMFIFQRPSDELETGFIPKVKSLPDSVKVWIDKNLDDKINQGEEGLNKVKFTAYLCMKAADGSIVNGWLASQTDLLATDWNIVTP